MAIPSALPRICTSIGHPAPSGMLAVAKAAAERGESLLELRLDLLVDPATGPRVVRSLLEDHPRVQVLAACRRTPNGGGFDGSIEEQATILRAAVAAGARLIDIEIESVEASPSLVKGLRDVAATVVSYHDFEKTGPLQPVLERLQRTGGDVLKVATRVRQPSDNLRLLALCSRHTNMVVTGMGETGSPARYLSPLRGGLFTYVSPDPGSGPPAPTAHGQVSVSVARKLYRIPEHGRSTRVYAVIAKPVGHSKSPLIHNRAFNKVGFDGIYLPLLVEPEDVGDCMETVRSLPIRGVSVTIPHKQAVIPFLDWIDPAARRIGAVNTLYWQGGALAGTNTDAIGITVPLGKRVDLKRSHVLVVGNGGAAKAAVVALQEAGSRVSVTGRNPRRVTRLAEQHGAEPITFGSLSDRYFDVLVQATPVGMSPHVGETLFPGTIPADVVFDLVYNPLETVLLKRATEQGKVGIGGIEMFVEQAAAQFQIWTGLDAPRTVMREAVLGRTVE